MQKLKDGARSARINRMSLLASDLLSDSESEMMQEFREWLESDEIIRVLELDGVDADFVDSMQSEEEEFQILLIDHNRYGFLAEVYIPNFEYRGNGVTRVSTGICTIEWVYAESIDGVVDRIIELSKAKHSKAVKKYETANPETV